MLDSNLASDIRNLLWEIDVTQPQRPRRTEYLPSIKRLQRPLSEVLNEYIITPDVSGPALKMLTDMLRATGLAHILAAPRTLVRAGKSVQCAIGDRYDGQVVADTPFGLKLEVAPRLSAEPNMLALDATLELKGVVIPAPDREPGWLEAESMGLRMTSTARDGEYHLIVGSGCERKDDEGYRRMLLVLAKATVVRDSALPRAADEILRPPPDLKHYLLDAYVARVDADHRLDHATALDVARLLAASRASDSGGTPMLPLTDEPILETYTVERLLRELSENVPGETFDSVVRLLKVAGYIDLEAHPHTSSMDGLPIELNVIDDELVSPELEKTLVKGVQLTVTCHALDDESARLEIECTLTEPTLSSGVRRRTVRGSAVLRNDRYGVIPVWNQTRDEPATYLMIRQRRPEKRQIPSASG
jgi:hypothetical protein